MKLMKPSLRELQKTITAVIDGHASPQEVQLAHSWIELSGKNLKVQDRIDIYTDGWFLRLEESLAEDFPAVRRSLTTKEWEKLVRQYLRRSPSSSFTLARAGDSFPLFLSEQHELPKWIADIGSFEKAIYKAQNAKDVEAWKVSELENYDADKVDALTFELQPSVALIRSHWNIVVLHERLSEQPELQDTFLVVSREGFTPTYRELDSEEYKFLKKASEGLSLGEIADLFQESNWIQWLSVAASDGLVHPRLKSTE